MEGFVAAFDPSLNSFGLSIIKLTEQRGGKHKIEIIECTHIPNRQFLSEQYGLKLANIEMRLVQIRKIYNPIVIVREEMANSPNHNEIRKLGAAQSLIDKVFYGYTIVGYSPTKIKKDICGDGRADKLDIQSALKQWVGDMCFSTDDSSDSLAIAYTWLLENNLI